MENKMAGESHDTQHIEQPRPRASVRISVEDMIDIGVPDDLMPQSSQGTIAEAIFFSAYQHQVERRRRHQQDTKHRKSGLRRFYECNFVKFWSKVPHLVWSFFIESFYIPAYRFEWGKFRNWSYDKHGRKAYEVDAKRLQDLEQRRERRNFIQIRREGAQILGSTLRDKHLGCRRVKINCAGVMFETQARTLQQFPDTLLGDANRRIRYWNPKNNEYFFDRNSECFESIIHFYQTGGSRLERPQHVPLVDFHKEIKFFDIKGHRVDEFAEEESDLHAKFDYSTLPLNLLKRKLWLLFEYPNSSHQAKIFSYLSILAIVLSTVTYCIDTMTLFRGKYKFSVEIVDMRDPMFFTETICVIFFTFEFIGRLYACPAKPAFIKSFPNIVDAISILPFLVQVSLFLSTHQTGGPFQLKYIHLPKGTYLEGFYRIAKVIRVFRILKLSRYSIGLRILGQTLHASLHELALLAFFLMVGVILFSSALYFIEGYYNPETKFTSIPGTFFWAVSTMTTTGFDRNEELPKTVPGKIIGSICAIAGVLTLSLPVPVVVANFTYFYQRGMQNKKVAKHKKKSVKKKMHVGACPFLPTCEADHYSLGSAQILSKSSKLGVKRWLEQSTKRRSTKIKKPESNHWNKIRLGAHKLIKHVEDSADP